MAWIRRSQRCHAVCRSTSCIPQMYLVALRDGAVPQRRCFLCGCWRPSVKGLMCYLRGLSQCISALRLLHANLHFEETGEREW